MMTLSGRHDAAKSERMRNLRSSHRAYGLAAIGAAALATVFGIALLTSDLGARFEGYEAHAAGGVAAEPDTRPAVEVAADGGCQAYTKEVLIGGESQTIHGTACQQPDGTWDIVE